MGINKGIARGDRPMWRLQLFVVIAALGLQLGPAEASGFQVHQDQVSVPQASSEAHSGPALGGALCHSSPVSWSWTTPSPSGPTST